MVRKAVVIVLVLCLSLIASAAAEGREVFVRTEVTKWGQMPTAFEVAGQALPEDVGPEDFTITGMAGSWGGPDQHPFECAVRAVEADGDGWRLIPEQFPEKYFYVKSLEIDCERHPELGFTSEDVTETTTAVADEFQWAEEPESRMTAWVYHPEAEGPVPAVLVFHGYGDEHNLLSYRTAVAWAEPESQAVRPCAVIAPTIITTYYGSEIARERIYAGIVGYIQQLIEAGEVDPDRVYVMGNSFGGMASFEIAEQYPDTFAAILALCPALNYSAKGTHGLPGLTDIPVFIAQAESDETIPCAVGRQAAEALIAAGNPNVQSHFYTDAEMVAAGASLGQSETYSFHHVELAVMEDDSYAEWLFSQRR